MDENPYEPPRTHEPIKSATILKRGGGVTLILLLTPPAIVVTLAGSCAAVTAIPPATFYLPFIAPFVVLTSLMVLATFLDRRRSGDPNSRRPRAGLFLATPPIVLLAAIVGFAVGALVVHIISSSEGGISSSSILVGAIAFLTLPTIALLTMLFVAWRARR